MAPSHQAVVTWLLSPSGGCVDWWAGTELGGHGVFKGETSSSSIKVTACDEGGIAWESSFDEAERLGTGSGYSAPDVFVFFRRTEKQRIGGFLDHWNGGRRKRSFENIEELWECRGGKKFNLKKLLKMASQVQIGLQGDKGSVLSDWFDLR